MRGNKASEKPSKSKGSKPNKAFNETLLADNLLESDFAEGVKRGVNDFIKSTNSTFGSGLHGSSDVTKTASDFIEIHRKFFEHNYQTSIRTYTDLVHDVQQITNHTTKNASGCFGK